MLPVPVNWPEQLYIFITLPTAYSILHSVHFFTWIVFYFFIFYYLRLSLILQTPSWCLWMTLALCKSQCSAEGCVVVVVLCSLLLQCSRHHCAAASVFSQCVLLLSSNLASLCVHYYCYYYYRFLSVCAFGSVHVFRHICCKNEWLNK